MQKEQGKLCMETARNIDFADFISKDTRFKHISTTQLESVHGSPDIMAVCFAEKSDDESDSDQKNHILTDKWVIKSHYSEFDVMSERCCNSLWTLSKIVYCSDATTDSMRGNRHNVFSIQLMENETGVRTDNVLTVALCSDNWTAYSFSFDDLPDDDIIGMVDEIIRLVETEWNDAFDLQTFVSYMKSTYAKEISVIKAENPEDK